MQAPQGEFYVTGGSLRSDTPSYVERSADHELYGALFGGQFCYVLTARQMGKSSLMVRTAARLERAQVRTAVLDLTAFGQNLAPEQWYYCLLSRLGERLDLESELETFWRANGSLGPLRRLMLAVEKVILPVRPRLVLFIDEIDAVRGLPFPTDEFFAAIRECYNRRTETIAFEGLTFCLLGVAAPSDLIRDPRMTPFNIGKRIELEDFSASEAQTLTAGFQTQDGRPDPRAPQLLSRVMHWTGGHPYLTQRLCSVAADSLVQLKESGPRSLVDAACRRLYLAPGAAERDDNILFVRERLLRGSGTPEPDPALLDMLDKICQRRKIADDETDPLIDVLKLSGVVANRHGVLRIRNRIYEQAFDRAWVRKHSSDAEQRRQRTAFRLGMVRAGLIGALLLSIMTALGANSYNNEGIARHLADQLRLAVRAQESTNDQLRQALDTAEAARDNARRNAVAAIAAEQRERREHVRADEATAEKERQRVLAERKSREALSQARIALAERAKSRATQARLLVADGWHLQEEGDLFGALLWFTEALKVERGVPEREAAHRLRIGTLLSQAPRLARVLSMGGPLRTACLSRSGRLAANVYENGAAKVWDLRKSPPSAAGLLLPEARIARSSAAISQDEARAVVVHGSSAAVWHRGFGWRRLELPEEVVWAGVSPDARRLAAAKRDGYRLWDVGRGAPITPWLPFKGTPGMFSFSADGRRLAVSSQGTLQIRSEDDAGRTVTLPEQAGRVLFASFSPDGRKLLTGDTATGGHLWEVNTGKRLGAVLGHAASVDTGCFSPDGRRAATGTSEGTVRVWDAGSGVARTPQIAQSGGIQRLQFTTDGTRLVAVSSEGALRLWNADTGRPLSPKLSHPQSILAANASPEGRKLRTLCADGTLREWALEVGGSGERVSAAPPPPALWPAHMKVVGLGETAVRVQDSRTRQSVTPWIRHTAGIWQAAIDAPGKRLLTGSNDQTARVWEIPSGQPLTPAIKHADALTCAAFDAISQRMLTASAEGVVWIRDAATGQPLLPALRHPRGVSAAAFAPNGKLLATHSERTLRVWDLVSGELLSPPFPERAGVRRIWFGPASDALFAQGEDGKVLRWRVTAVTAPIESVSALAEALAGRKVSLGSLLLPLLSDESASAWKAAAPTYATLRPRTIPPIEQHRRGAEERELAGQWSEALVHLNKLVHAFPEDRSLHARRGRAHAELSRWREAAADYQRALDPGPPEAEAGGERLNRYRLALAQLKAGDASGYRSTCAELMRRYGPRSSDRALDLATWTCALAPNSPDTVETALRLHRRLLGKQPGSSSLMGTRGALLYRSGRLEEAAAQLEEAIRRRGHDGEVVDRLFLSVVYARLGRRDEAREWLDNAIRQMAAERAREESGETEVRQTWEDRSERDLLCRESEFLITNSR